MGLLDFFLLPLVEMERPATALAGRDAKRFDDSWLSRFASLKINPGR